MTSARRIVNIAGHKAKEVAHGAACRRSGCLHRRPPRPHAAGSSQGACAAPGRRPLQGGVLGHCDHRLCLDRVRLPQGPGDAGQEPSPVDAPGVGPIRNDVADASRVPTPPQLASAGPHQRGRPPPDDHGGQTLGAGTSVRARGRRLVAAVSRTDGVGGLRPGLAQTAGGGGTGVDQERPGQE